MPTSVPFDPSQHDELSLTCGGPWFHLLQRLRLQPDLSNLGTRFALLALCLSWLPVMALLVFQRIVNGTWDPLFMRTELHLRMLVSLPLLLWGEWLFDHRVKSVHHQLIGHDLISAQTLTRWLDVLGRLVRVRDSWAPELALVVMVYGVSVASYFGVLPLGVLRWLAPTIHQAGAHWSKATPAWWWYLLVSQPLFLFVLLRWLSRWLLLTHMMWALARIFPRIEPLHADRFGGLAFLGEPVVALRLFASATSVALMSVWFDELAISHVQPAVFATDLLAFLALALLLALLPYALIVRPMVETKHEELLKSTALMTRYTRCFRERWLAGGTERIEASEILGHQDFSGLADLGTSFSVADDMRVVLPGFEQLRAYLIASFGPFMVIILAYGPSAADLLKDLLTSLLGG